MLQALIFDVDGTLAETERDGHRRAFNAAFREAGLPFEWDERTYGELLKVTGGKERIRFFLDNCDMCPKLSDHQIRALHKRKTELYTAWLETGDWVLRPGIARLIREARAEGLKLAIATTTTQDNVEALLKHVGLLDAFDMIGAGDIVPKKKPAPDIYLWVLKQLGINQKGAIAFEDSENGLKAARAAGLRVIVTPSYYTREEHFDGAWAVLSDLGELDKPARDLLTGQNVIVHTSWLRRGLTQ